MTRERADRLIGYLREVPGIIHNDRLGGPYKGDTETPEQKIPATGFEDRDWEVCMTMNDTWGYQSFDHNWKSTDDLIRKLCDIVSKGGNFLLNVGPTAEGRIPEASVERLRAIGDWMEVNGEAIYGTTANPFENLSWGRCTKKVRPEGTTLYFHVFEWPEDGWLEVSDLQARPTSVRLLGEIEPLAFVPGSKTPAAGLRIQLPEKAPELPVPVIKVAVRGEWLVE
jgi:alpha-L-fucosidase